MAAGTDGWKTLTFLFIMSLLCPPLCLAAQLGDTSTWQGWRLDPGSFHQFGFTLNGWQCSPCALLRQLTSGHRTLRFPSAALPLLSSGAFQPLWVVPAGSGAG